MYFAARCKNLTYLRLFWLIYGVEEYKQEDIISTSCNAAIKLLELFCPNAKDITEVYKHLVDFFHASVNSSLHVTKKSHIKQY